VITPAPQVTEQEDQGDQWLQLPSCLTKGHREKSVIRKPIAAPLWLNHILWPSDDEPSISQIDRVRLAAYLVLFGWVRVCCVNLHRLSHSWR